MGSQYNDPSWRVIKDIFLLLCKVWVQRVLNSFRSVMGHPDAKNALTDHAGSIFPLHFRYLLQVKQRPNSRFISDISKGFASEAAAFPLHQIYSSSRPAFFQGHPHMAKMRRGQSSMLWNTTFQETSRIFSPPIVFICQCFWMFLACAWWERGLPMQDVDSRSRPFGNLLHFDADKFPFFAFPTNYILKYNSYRGWIWYCTYSKIDKWYLIEYVKRDDFKI